MKDLKKQNLLKEKKEKTNTTGKSIYRKKSIYKASFRMRKKVTEKSMEEKTIHSQKHY